MWRSDQHLFCPSHESYILHGIENSWIRFNETENFKCYNLLSQGFFLFNKYQNLMNHWQSTDRKINCLKNEPVTYPPITTSTRTTPTRTTAILEDCCKMLIIKKSKEPNTRKVQSILTGADRNKIVRYRPKLAFSAGHFASLTMREVIYFLKPFPHSFVQNFLPLLRVFSILL